MVLSGITYNNVSALTPRVSFPVGTWLFGFEFVDAMQLELDGKGVQRGNFSGLMTSAVDYVWVHESQFLNLRQQEGGIGVHVKKA